MNFDSQKYRADVRVGLLVYLAAMLATPFGCQPVVALGTSAPRDYIAVVCTTGMVADMLANVGGSRVRITTLMGPGVDPHLYRGTLGDARRLVAADVVFYSGLHLEGRLADTLEHLAQRKPVFAITERLVAANDPRLRAPDGSFGQHDPHVWFDVALWAEGIAVVADRLSELDPAHAAEYHANAVTYRQQLMELDTYARTQLATIPKGQRVLVTAHDAFGYFGAAYDLQVEGLQGMSTADETDLATMNRLVTLLVDRRIPAVFVESSVPPKAVQALIEACRAQGHVVREGGELFSDCLGPKKTAAETFVGTVRANVDTIVNALRLSP